MFSDHKRCFQWLENELTHAWSKNIKYSASLLRDIRPLRRQFFKGFSSMSFLCKKANGIMVSHFSIKYSGLMTCVELVRRSYVAARKREERTKKFCFYAGSYGISPWGMEM